MVLLRLSGVARQTRPRTRWSFGRSAPAFRAFQLLLLLAVFLGAARAQSWTIQTVAFRDLRDAMSAAAELRDLGLDAYHEFSMNRGRQYVRVRLGCYRDRPAAEAMAAVLRGRVTAAAVVAPLTSGAPVAGCVRQDVGFLKPDRWSIDKDTAGIPTFDVEVAGHSARIVHTGVRWALVQQDDPMPDASRLPAGSFEQGSLGGASVVMEVVTGRHLALCPGTLLATVGEVALIEQRASVVACRLDSGGSGQIAGQP